MTKTSQITSVGLLTALDSELAVEPRRRLTPRALAARLVNTHVVGPGLYDETRLAAALRHTVRTATLSRVERGVFFAHVLEALPASARAQLALDFVYGCRPGQLETVGRGGLASLRAACSLADTERCGSALEILDAELSRSVPRMAQVSGVVVFSQDLGAMEVRGLTRRVSGLDIAQLLGGLVLIVRPRGEESTDAAVLLRNLKLSLDPEARAVLERAVADGSVLTVDRARLTAAPARRFAVAPVLAALTSIVSWFGTRGALRLAPQNVAG